MYALVGNEDPRAVSGYYIRGGAGRTIMLDGSLLEGKRFPRGVLPKRSPSV